MAGWFFFAPVQWMLQTLEAVTYYAVRTKPKRSSQQPPVEVMPGSSSDTAAVTTSSPSSSLPPPPEDIDTTATVEKEETQVQRLEEREQGQEQGDVRQQEQEQEQQPQEADEPPPVSPPTTSTAADTLELPPPPPPRAKRVEVEAPAPHSPPTPASLYSPPFPTPSPHHHHYNKSSSITLPPPPPPPTMSSTSSAAESSVRKILHTLQTSSPTSPQTAQLLRDAKKQLMGLNALIPTPNTSSSALLLARSTLEAGALLSIRAQDPAAFTRYYQQLQPFYEVPESRYAERNSGGSGSSSQRSKVTGLYLLLLLTRGDYAGFHTLLEGLEMEREEGGGVGEAADVGNASGGGGGLEEGDRFIRYPVMLEQWLMEGAYDRVWGATKGEGVPSEEFGVFSEILIGTIRSEIASCSEKAYPSIPVANAKNLLFLDSEGSVVAFAQGRGWVVTDGRIYFPLQQAEGVRTEKEILVASGQVIENTIGYARELETIV